MGKRSDTGQTPDKISTVQPDACLVPSTHWQLDFLLYLSPTYTLKDHSSSMISLLPFYLGRHSKKQREVPSLTGSRLLWVWTDVANKDSFNLISSFVIFGNSMNLSHCSFFLSFFLRKWRCNLHIVKCTGLKCIVWSNSTNTHISRR